MTIASELTALQTNLENVYDAVEAKGGTLPVAQNFDNLATAVGSISTSDELTATNTTGSAIASGDRVWVEPDVSNVQDFTLGHYNPSAVNDLTIDNTNKTATWVANSANIGIMKVFTTFPTPQSSVEIQIRTKHTVSGSGDSGIYCRFFGDSIPDYYYAGNCAIRLGIDNYSAIHGVIDNDGGLGSFTNYTLGGGVVGQFYYIKCVITDNTITFSYSTDGETWSGINTYTGSSGMLSKLTSRLYHSLNVNGSGSTKGTEMDLANCYIKVDGNLVWTPYQEVLNGYNIIPSKSVSSTSFTGIAQEVIANSSTGAVKTLLDGNGTYAPTTATKSITTNGTYIASAENVYGLSEVTVNVPTPDVWHNWKTDVTVNSSNTSQYSSQPSVVYGNGVYLMLPVTGSGASSTYYTSTDGVNFTSRTFPGNVQSVTFGHGLFIAAYVQGTIYSSSDGETWTTVTSSATFGGNYVICNFVNDKFYICPSTYAQGVAYSDDGINWTYDSSAAVYGHLLYCNGLYVRYPDSGSTWVYTSSDLTNWTDVFVYDKVGTLTRISCGNGVFVVQKANDTSILYTTTDFSTFTSHQIENNGRIDFGNGLFVAPQTTATSGSVGSIAYSSDGENWTTASITQSHMYTKYSAGPIWFAGDYFFAVGSNVVSMCRIQFAQSECFTLTSAPTTSTQVYEIPKKTSALTITSVGTGTITLSDSKVYNRNSAGDVESPVLGTKTIDTNGTYTAASDYLDGFSEVTVDIQGIGIPLEISSGVLQPKSSSFEIDWPDVTSINCGNFGLTNAFNNSAITKFSLPNLILSTTQASNLLQCCRGCTSLTTVDLSSLQEAKSTGGLSYAFYGCTNLTSVNMQNLETIEGNNAFNYTFYNTGLTSFRFQKLKSISHGSGFLYTVMDCSFGGTTPITSLYFDALETVARQENLQNMLSGVTGCTVHFPAALQSTIGSWTSVTNGFGGTNTTVLFDL